MIEDLRQALHQMRSHPGYTFATVITLALGIGANTAIFSLAHGVLLRPLPYAHRDALVHIVPRVTGATGDELFFPVLEMLDYRLQNRTLASVVEYHSMSFTLLGHGEPDRVETGVVSASFFREFGVSPLLGRDFRPQDEEIGAEPVLLLTYEYWRNRFGGDSGIIGQRLRMNDRPIQVIGVLPRLPAYPGRDKVFMLTAGCPFRSSERVKADRGTRMVSLWGRLKPGVSPEQAGADLAAIAARL